MVRATSMGSCDKALRRYVWHIVCRGYLGRRRCGLLRNGLPVMNNQISCAAAVKRDIESRFSVGDLFTMRDFSELEKTYSRARIRSVCQTLSESGYMDVVGKYSLKIGKLPPLNHYRVSKITTPNCDYPAGSITIWHPMKTPPVNPGPYKIKQWDRAETIREWRDGTWWNTNGNQLNSAFVIEWCGVTR